MSVIKSMLPDGLSSGLPKVAMPTDELIKAIANVRRRNVLRAMRSEQSVQTEIVVNRVVVLEYRSMCGAPRNRVELDLLHNHLPVLEDLDVIKVAEEKVRRTPLTADVARVARAIETATEDDAGGQS